MCYRGLFALVLLPSLAWADWPQWRGPQRDGVARETPKAWPAELKRLWKVEIGEGHSSPLLVGQRVYSQARQGDQEIIRAHDLKDGSVLWSQKYNASAALDGAVGWHGQTPKSTPCLAEGRLFTLSIQGTLHAWDAETGKMLWRQTFEKAFPKTYPIYGTATSPIVHDGRVIVWVGSKKRGALLALDVKTGKQVWSLPVDGPGYSSPVIGSFAGLPQLITQSETLLLGVNPKSGRELWRQPFTTGYDQNSVTPLLVGDTLVYSGYEKNVFAVRPLKAGTTFKLNELWKLREHSFYMSSPVQSGGVVFGHSMTEGGTLLAVDAKTGKIRWKKAGFGEYCPMIVAGEHLLVQTTEGKLKLLNAKSAEYEELREYTIADDKTWAHPALSGNRLITKDKTHLYAWEVE